MTNNNFEPDLNNSYDQLSVETEGITVNFQKSDALVGQVLDGRFLIEKDLTESGADAGGIGLVYLARDMKLLDRKVVVKILKQSALETANLSRKFQQEKEALIRLDHPNIVRILDSGNLADGNPFMVMEYIEGYSLKRKLEEAKRLAFDEAANIIESVAEGLSVAHSKKILHRDIKPANIMLTPQEEGFDRVRLIDFGIARVEDSQVAQVTATAISIGTLHYMAPEQLQGKSEQTPALDIYALGVVIYQMLTGELPFNPQNHVGMFLMQEEGVKVLPGELRKDLPAEAEQILLSALEFEAEKRPQNARAFGRSLAKILRESVDYKTNRDGQIPLIGKTAPANFIGANPFANLPTEPLIKKEELNHSVINTQTTERRKKSSNWLLWLALALLLLAAISLPVGVAVWKGFGGATENADTAEKLNVNSPQKTDENSAKKTNAPIAENMPSRNLTYFLNVQKMRDKKPFEEPFKSSGQEIFESGYKFKLNFQSDSAGFMYAFNEDKDERGNTVYNLLFPTPKNNNGSAQVKAKQQIETGNNTFKGKRGTEIVWLVWTAEKQEVLESARQEAFNSVGRVSNEKNAGQLADFLQKYAEAKPEISKDTANRQTLVKGKGDVVVHRIELEHR